MRLIDVETLRLKDFSDDEIPPYAILSHTWGAAGDEMTFEDIGKGHLEKPGKIKLQGCCKQAKKDKLGYIWIDTCCIDKASSAELLEAINSMFKWYRRASVCYVYLSDVSCEEDFVDLLSGTTTNISCRWFQRGWTLQELLAPQKVEFYDQGWRYIGEKADLSEGIGTIANIPKEFLLDWKDLHTASVAQRMSWAANRQTTRKEDIAYCLLGIFDVTMSMLYGEGGEKAFIRLQQEIMKKTGDQSILAWGLDFGESTLVKPTDALSAGVLATSPSDFENSGSVTVGVQDTPVVNTFDISGGRLRVHLPLHTTCSEDVYGLLNCGDSEKVVGIPLRKAVTGGSSDDYIRPQGYNPILLPKTESTVLAQTIYIQTERQRNVSENTSPRCWLHLEGYQRMDLKLDSIHPQVTWDKRRALIITANGPEAEPITRQFIIRFRSRNEESRDIVVILEIDKHGSQPQARPHVMTLSKGTTSEHLAQQMIHLRPEAFGKQSVSNGDLEVEVSVKEERIIREPIFTMKLARMSSAPMISVDANWELNYANQKAGFVKLLRQEDPLCLKAESLSKEALDKGNDLDATRKRLVVIKESLEQLKEEQTLLEDRLKKEVQDLQQLAFELGKADRLRAELLGQKSRIQQHLDEAEGAQGRENWLELFIRTQLNLASNDMNGLISNRLGNCDTEGLVPLIWAAFNGYKAVTRLLLDKGADVNAKDKRGMTPVTVAISKGHNEVARLLLDKGADIEAKNEDGLTPLMLATSKGHEMAAELLIEKGADTKARYENGWTLLMDAVAKNYLVVAQLLIEKGADIEAKDKAGWTPLMVVAHWGHDTLAQLLIDSHADIEARNQEGWTPLMIAARNGNEIVAQLLVENGADIEAQNKAKRTPLMLAVMKGNMSVVRLLVEKGADCEAKDVDDLTPLKVAERGGREAFLRLLVKKKHQDRGEQQKTVEDEDTDNHQEDLSSLSSG